MRPCLRKAAVFQKPLKIFPCWVFNHAKRSEWNFVRIIFNFDLFVLEIHINCRAQIIPVHIIEAQHGVRIITEVLRTFQLLVNRLATDAVLFRQLRCSHSLLMQSQHLCQLLRSQAVFASCAAFIMWFFTFYKLYFLRDRPQLL